MEKQPKYYSLYAIYVDYSQDRIGGNFERHERQEEVARFSSKRRAQAYVKKAYLKNPDRYPAGFSVPKIFRKKSLLRNAHDYEIEEYYEEPVVDPPFDPEFQS